MTTETRRVEIVNPARLKSGPVTDRALRYRANAVKLPGPRICAGCGAARNIDVDHVNGREEDTAPKNLLYLCRSCNTKKGIHFRNVGRGRLTNQYNPGAVGAKSAGQWITAISALKGQSADMSLADAIAMVHATPAARRSDFQRELWVARKRIYGRSGRATSEVPF